MKNIALYVLIPFLLLSTGCATIFHGTSEKVEIKTNVPDVQVSVNGKYQPSNRVVLKKKQKVHSMVISKPNYEPVTMTFTRAPRSMYNVSSSLLILGGSGMLTGLAIMAGVGADEYSVGLVAGSAALLVPAIVDISTKANTTFGYRKVELELIPVFPTIPGDKKISIACTGVNFRIQPGTPVGEVWSLKNGNPTSKGKFVWEESSNISSEDLEVQVNNDLANAGFHVPGLSNKFDNSKKEARFILNSEIKSLKLDRYLWGPWAMAYATGQGDMKGDAIVVWTLYDSKLKRVVFEKEFSTTAHLNSVTTKLMLLNLITASLKKAVNEPAFLDAVTKDPVAAQVNKMNSEEPVQLVQVPSPEKITEVIESAVTIDLGNGHGSGFIISSDGYLLTNYHVVEGETSVSVILSNGLSLEAEVVRFNADLDMALLKIPGKGFKPLPLSKTSVMAGSPVIAVGTPGRVDLGQSVSKGIVSGKREIDGAVYIQTDVSISPGSSGGPLLDENFEVIGLVTSKLKGEGVEGVGFAIPIQAAIENLKLIVVE